MMFAGSLMLASSGYIVESPAMPESPLMATLDAPVLAPATTPAGALPTVTAHGMGDSCFNSGMQSITQQIGTTLGTYSVCIPTGNRLTDTTNGVRAQTAANPLASSLYPSFSSGLSRGPHGSSS
jgi:hypothetical protein